MGEGVPAVYVVGDRVVGDIAAGHVERLRDDSAHLARNVVVHANSLAAVLARYRVRFSERLILPLVVLTSQPRETKSTFRGVSPSAPQTRRLTSRRKALCACAGASVSARMTASSLPTFSSNTPIATMRPGIISAIEDAAASISWA